MKLLNSYEPYKIKNILSQNSKMKKSSRLVYNWTLPAFRIDLNGQTFQTCPNASKCAVGCYAKQGAYVWPNVAAVHRAKLELSLRADFASIMIEAITAVYRPGKEMFIRIHDAGDFYSAEYVLKWLGVMRHFSMNSNIKFYAYTKQVDQFQRLSLPDNFTVIYSYGGKQDKLIKETDRHSRVFEDQKSLLSAGYIDASHDDMLALTDNPKVGLVYHGQKSYAKTSWQKVS